MSEQPRQTETLADVTEDVVKAPSGSQSPEGVPVTESSYSDEDVQRHLDEAAELKLEGNDKFRAQQWNDALATYRRALARLPKRPAKKVVNISSPEDELDSDSQGKTRSTEADTQDEDIATIPSPLQQQCSKARAVLNANIAACYVKLGEHKEAVTASTEALSDDPDYVKALQRRAASNEQIDSWSSLTSARDDYTKLLGILPPGTSQYIETQRLLQAISPRIEVAQKRETGEMLDKLKGLGNSILGNFGMSTDNFQFVPNGQGGYSMNFVR